MSSIGSYWNRPPSTTLRIDFWLPKHSYHNLSQNPFNIEYMYHSSTNTVFLSAEKYDVEPPETIYQVGGLCKKRDMIVDRMHV